MTIYSSFNSFSLHNSESATSLVSHISEHSRQSALSNTDTSSSVMSLTQLFPALPTQDEDWQKFGYLLDSSINNLAPKDESESSHCSSSIKLSRSNSMPSSPQDSGYTSGSSMDVEIGFSVYSKQCPTCDFLKAYEEDFIGCDFQFDAKKDLLLKFLLENNNTQKNTNFNNCLTNYNGICKPKWHNKLLKLPSVSTRTKRRTKSKKFQNRNVGKNLKGLHFCKNLLK